MLLFAMAGAADAAGGCTAYPAAPEHPAYDIDVRPILMAHCARCHGAGDKLNVPTEPTGPNAPTLPSISDPAVQTTFTSLNLFVTQFDTTGACMNPPADCINGAGSYHALIATTVEAGAKPPTAMPPAPAPALTEWESGTILNWSKNPVCSNSADPDPSICPNGPGVSTSM